MADLDGVKPLEQPHDHIRNRLHALCPLNESGNESGDEADDPLRSRRPLLEEVLDLLGMAPDPLRPLVELSGQLVDGLLALTRALTQGVENQRPCGLEQT